MRKFLLLAPLTLWVLCSCKEEKIPTYRLAPDSTAETPAASTLGAVPEMLEVLLRPGTVVWKVPENWKADKAGQFITAAYTLPGGGRITISKLNGNGGGIPANLNRWRDQLGFKPLPENEVIGQPLKIIDSSEAIQLFNLTAENSSDDAIGIFAGILPLKTETWYFKFSGPVGVLRKSEDVFADFLRSIRIAGSHDS